MQVVSVRRDGGLLSTGDILLRVDATDIRSRADLFSVMRRKSVGRVVTIEVERAGERVEIPASF
jgi:type II secretory pathway component PulC